MNDSEGTLQIDLSKITRAEPQVPSRNVLPFLLNNCGLVGLGVELGCLTGGYSERILLRYPSK